MVNFDNTDLEELIGYGLSCDKGMKDCAGSCADLLSIFKDDDNEIARNIYNACLQFQENYNAGPRESFNDMMKNLATYEELLANIQKIQNNFVKQQDTKAKISEGISNTTVLI